MTMTELTQTTPDLTGLLREIRESLAAGRIDRNDADIVRKTSEKCGDERGRFILRHFEKLNNIQTYYETRPYGFKFHEFTYDCRSTSPKETAKIVAALKEALTTLSFYSRLEGCK
jgi:ribosomal protein L29